MKKILIIGCGFGGISCCAALASLGGHKGGVEITVIDSRSKMYFLPMLPDIIGRGISADFLSYNIESFLKRRGINFVNAQVSAVDLEKRQVSSGEDKYSYDYLVIASGSETNFYANDALEKYAYKLDDAEDAVKIRETALGGRFDVYLIGGAGYTGIEAATNLRLCLKASQQGKRVIIVERAPSILGPLPEWMKDFARANLKRMDIEVITNTSVVKIEGGNIQLATGESFNNAMLIWAAGVRSADFIQKLSRKKNPQGRLEVDQYLRLDDSSFAIGDAAMVKDKAGFLRMAVQFSIAQGKCAASNIIRSIDGRSLLRYRPKDLGYIIPMANNYSCGRVFGINLRGFLPTVLHYLMCIYRSFGLKNKFGIIADLTRGGAR